MTDHNSHVHYEKRDIEPGTIFKVGLGVMLVTVLVAVALVGYLGWQEERAAAGDPAETAVKRFEPGRPFPAPQLQQTPTADIEALRAHEQEVLGSYAWVDRDKGVVRLPIEEAMRLTLERGLPARGVSRTLPPVAAPAAEPQAGGDD